MTEHDRGSFAAAARLLGLMLMLCVAWLHGTLVCRGTLLQRGQWRQRWCRRIMRYLQLETDLSGIVPASGLIVANHVSYLDVLVLGALTPASFVAKKEVRSWPVIGGCCAMGGTLYLDRDSPRAVAAINRRIAEAFAQGAPVVIFPEGTTTAGDVLLPLHPALFHAAIQKCAPIVPVALTYAHHSGRQTVRERIAYWGGMTLVPHLQGFMKLRKVRAAVQVGTHPVHARTRTDAATACEAALQQMLGIDATTSVHDETSAAVAETMSHVAHQMSVA